MFHKSNHTLLVVFLLFSLSACKNQTPDSPRCYGDTLVIGDFYESTTINPVLASSGSSAYLIPLIFDGLVKINEKTQIQPNLASHWEVSTDGLRYIFHLRRGVKFHNGVELTAEDVKFTFNKIMEAKGKSPYWNSFELVRNVIVRDRYTVEITLKKPNASFPFAVDVGILPERISDTHTTGTGPFKLMSSAPEEIILKANDNYFLGRPYLNKIVIKIFENQQIAWVRLVRGDVDFMPEVPLGQHDATAEMSAFKTLPVLDPYYYILVFNLNERLFKDKRVRQALNYAVNKGEIISKILSGKAQIASGTIWPQSWAYDPEIEPYPYDPPKALMLLKEAGWKDTDGDRLLDRYGRPFRFTLCILKGDELTERCALMIQEQLMDVGIKMRVRVAPLVTATDDYLFRRKFDTVLLNIISDDPDKNYRLWHSSQIEEGFNVFSYKNNNVDALLDEGRGMLDPEERKKVYYQFQKAMLEDPPGIFLFWRQCLAGIHKRFREVRINPARLLLDVHEWYVPKEEQKYK